MVTYWHRKGSASRTVSWVYASKAPVSKSRTYEARWMYRVPGGTWKTGGRWKRLTHVSRANFAEASWGEGGRTGRSYPQGTQVCVQNRGMDRLCMTLR